MKQKHTNEQQKQPTTLIPWQAKNSPLLTPKPRNKYTQPQKDSVINLYLSGKAVIEIFNETHIPKSTIHRWIAEKKLELEGNRPALSAKHFSQLERKISRLENIIKILKSANCKVSDSLKKRLHIAESLVKEYNIDVICEALDIARGTFYNHILRNKRDNSWYAQRREVLRIRILEIYNENRQILGAAKIHAILKNQGVRTSPEMVRELMRDMGLLSIRNDAKDLYDKEQKRCKNYINQNFDTSAPNQVWVSDVTYYKFNNSQFFICAVIDLFSRKVVGYKIGLNNSTQLVKSTVKFAYETRKPNSNLLLHTDRGSNYRSKTFFEYLKSVNITHSYSRAYVPYDNSVVESFFATLKREELYRRKYRSDAEFKSSVAEYISFFNENRPHQKLHYKTPNQKEAEFLGKPWSFSKPF